MTPTGEFLFWVP